MSSFKALVIDDCEDGRFILKKILNKTGLEVLVASGAVEGLAICEEQMPYFIFLDWWMPEVDGLEFIRRLRQMPGSDRPTIIMCTCEDEVSKVQLALKEGIDGYLVKPFNETDVHKHIVKHIPDPSRM